MSKFALKDASLFPLCLYPTDSLGNAPCFGFPVFALELLVLVNLCILSNLSNLIIAVLNKFPDLWLVLLLLESVSSLCVNNSELYYY